MQKGSEDSSKIKQNNRKKLIVYLILIYCVLLAGRYHQCYADSKLLENDVGKECTIDGEIIVQKKKSFGYEYYIKANTIQIHSEKVKNTHLKFQFYSQENIKLHSKITMIGKLSLFALPKNKGEWNQNHYFKGKNIYYQIKKVKLQKIENVKDNILTIFRQWVYQQTNQFLPKEERALFLSLFTGDKSELEQELIEGFRKIGISHILAVSGLHIGFLAWGIGKLLKKMPLSYGFQYSILLMSLVFYLFFTGGQPSTWRAVIMFVILESSYFWERAKDEKRAFWLTLAILLFINPYSIYDVGFILSFATVASLLYVYPLLFAEAPKWMKPIGITLTVQISLLPIFSIYFHRISIVAFLANIIVIPIISIFLGSSGLALLISGISSALAQIFVGSGYFLLKIGLWISEKVGQIPWSEISIRSMSIIEIVIFYIIIILVLITKKKQYLWGLIFSIIIFIPYSWQPQLTMLDVGQAESMVIEYRNHCLVIDTGLSGNKSTLSFLAHQGRNKVDMVLLSHLDRDHAGGLIQILENCQVNSIGISANYLHLNEQSAQYGNLKKTWQYYLELLALAKKYKVPVTYWQSGDQIAIADLKFDFLYPFIDDFPGLANDFSFVAQMQYGETQMLFTGDISSRVEKKLNKKAILEDVEVLKVAHHGSKYSSQPNFLRIIKPELAIISCGRYNKYGHPSQELITYFQERGILVKVTAWDGIISLRFSKKGEVIINE